MPEWPERHVARARLERALVGRIVSGVQVGDPVVAQRQTMRRVLKAVTRGKDPGDISTIGDKGSVEPPGRGIGRVATAPQCAMALACDA